MNDRTGEIRNMDPEEARRLNEELARMRSPEQWHDVTDLSEDERLKLQGMNRKERRAYFARQRRSKGTGGP